MTGGGDERRLRAVDLAATAGISVQQVRNYVDLGVLPSVERTPSGYRIFTEAHARALAVARTMADGHGWTRTREIMLAVNGADPPAALAALDAGHAELDRERAEIRRVLGAFETVVTSPRVAVPRRTVRVGAVADLVGVRTSQLRSWEARGLLRPVRERGTGYRVYDEAEVRAAQVVALLRRGAYPFDIIMAVLDEMRSTSSPQRVRAELARREQDLHRRSLRRLAASAALYDYLRYLGSA
ncbi:DNA-binding transcriptional regulator, MerR family [Micromonospora phaseoli]|uniref:DNA-binding transcriptional regulator, MerR family n=1 Tax=Micromonospora phaseoli TaxID=1144548 RepID=A0A1H6UFJ0_9ACTN|nr:MerR family transcriptional regulator [Micromonospora phaseoli]PZV98947.1 DNA-binding transcriptional MerR regulator [Micromonospora phaseoli]GIJ76301.1 MerR family transcriptional regulator [Micromonospora phaseoli]SEI89444.1 DNA-binding transcriptional regulator, MerR family [Micromonospora phaseoli]